LDVLIVAGVCGVSFVASALLWHLWVAPELVLSLLDDAPLSSERRPTDLRALRWLRWMLGAVVLLVGFLTGAVLAFLAAT
jgi:hypothetical protein